MGMTNGELRTLIAPIFGLDRETIQNAVIIIRTSDDQVGVHGMFDSQYSIINVNMEHIELLAAAIAVISGSTKGVDR